MAASTSATLGGYQRRFDDWKLQEQLAAKELEQIDKQILAGEIRLAIAENDLSNHELQIENAKEVEAWMRATKFTNQQLYGWMVSQLSTLYFRTYQLAYDLAKRAEKAFQYELGVSDSSFIQFGYWDSLKKGLLAGERLYHDLKRMEVAYLEQNKREYELTKHVSLAIWDPLALLLLREQGECIFNLPEVIFDLDYPGHYMRRTKSVSLTIPCVTGPYTGVNCTLTLLGHSYRCNTQPGLKHARNTNGKGIPIEDDRFVDGVGAIQSIATSSGQNDSGLFELNFRDERYLPFEGAGVISQWRLELSGKWKDSAGQVVSLPQFDFNTISDVVLHLRYTAREGGNQLKQQVVAQLQEALNTFIDQEGQQGLPQMFSLRHEFPSEWHRFLYPTAGKPNEIWKQTLQLDLNDRFPFQFKGKTIKIKVATLFLKLRDGYEYDDAKPLVFDLLKKKDKDADESLATNIRFKSAGSFSNLPYAEAFGEKSESVGKWAIEVKEKVMENNNEIGIGNLPDVLRQTVKINGTDHYRLNPEAIQDIYLVCHYTA